MKIHGKKSIVDWIPIVGLARIDKQDRERYAIYLGSWHERVSYIPTAAAAYYGTRHLVETYAPSIDRVVCDAFENVLRRIL